MIKQKQKGPQALQSQADREGNITKTSIPRIQTFWGQLCDADLVTIEGDVSFYRHLVKVGEMNDLFMRYKSVFWAWS